MANDFIAQWRAKNPDDERSDAFLTFELGQQFPDALEKFPEFKADYERLTALPEPTVGDYVKQAAGSTVRGVGNMLASVPKGLAVAASFLDDKVIDLSPGSNAPQDKGLFKLGEAGQDLTEKVAPQQVEALQNSWIATKIPQGIGSALAFLAGGAAGAAAKAPAWATAGTLGTLSTYDDQFSDAKAKGASDEKALTAALASTPFGASEAVPMAKWITRLSKASGVPIKTALFEVGKETLEEGLQEFIQQSGNNLVAKGIYDPEREIFQGAPEGAGVGAATGFFMSLLTQAIGRARGSTSSGDPTSQGSNGDTRAAATPPPSAPAVAERPVIDPMAQIISPSDLTPENRSFVEQVIRQQLAEPESVATQTALRALNADPALAAYYGLQKPVIEAEMLQAQMAEPVSPATITGSNARQGAEMPAEAGAGTVGAPIPAPEIDLAAAQAQAQQQREAELAARRDELRRAMAQYGQDAFAAPPAPAAPAAPEAPATPPPAPHTLVPVLTTPEGEIISAGLSHADALTRATPDKKLDAFTAHEADDQHRFLDTATGRVLNRAEAGQLSGVPGELQSEQLDKAQTAKNLAAIPAPVTPTPASAPAPVVEPVAVATPAASRAKAIASVVEGAKAALAKSFAALEKRMAEMTPEEQKALEPTKDADGNIITPENPFVAQLNRLNEQNRRLEGAAEAVTISDLVDYDALTADEKKGATGNGQRNKVEALEESNLTPERLLLDSRAEKTKGATRKLVAFQKGDDVILAGVWKDDSTKVRERVAGEKTSVPLTTFMADGWTPIAAIKTLTPTRNFRAQYSGAEWAAEAMEMRGRVASAAASGKAMQGQIANKTEPSPVAIEDQPTDPQGEEVAAEEVGGIGESNEVAQKAKASGLTQGPTDAEIAARSVLTEIAPFSEEQAGAIWDEFGGGELTIEEAADVLADMHDAGGASRAVANSAYEAVERGIENEVIDYKERLKEAVRQAAEILSRVAGAAAGRSDFAQSLAAGFTNQSEKQLDVLAHRASQAPTLIYQDENGEPKAKPSDQPSRDTGANLAGAVAAASHDRGAGPRAAEAERAAIEKGGIWGRRNVARSIFDKLVAFAAENYLILDPEAFQSTVMNRKVLGEGAEHTVWIDKPTERVIKLTHPDVVGGGNVGADWNVADYLTSLQQQNELFGTDLRFEGIVTLDGELPQIVISQSLIKGQPATDKQIAKFFTDRGFTLMDGTWARGDLKVSDAGSKNVMVLKDGTVVPFDVHVTGDVVVTAHRDGREGRGLATPSVVASRFASVLDALNTYGVPTSLVRETVDGVFKEWGAFSKVNGREMVILSMDDQLRPTRENLRTLLHEAFHAVFYRESAEMQNAGRDAINRASDEVLGISGFNAKITDAGVKLADERLAESMAREFEAEGFNPQQARGMVQTIWRVLKSLMARTAMAVQRMLGLPPSPAVARAYFRARFEQALTARPMSLTSFVGGPQPTKAEKAEHFTRLTGSDYVGEIYDHATGWVFAPSVLADSVAAARFNSSVIAFSPARRAPQLLDVVDDLPALSLPPNVLLDEGPSLIERAARAFLALFGKGDTTVTAGDGTRVAIKSSNPQYRNGSAFAMHLMSENSLSSTLGQRPSFNPSKAKWIGLIRNTLENAQVRLDDPKNGSKIYAVRYADGTPGGTLHFVVTRPDGSLLQHGVGNATLTTQFASSRMDGRQIGMVVEWEKARDPSKVIQPIRPGSPGLGPTPSVRAQTSIQIGTVNEGDVLAHRAVNDDTVSPDLDSQFQKATDAAALNAKESTLRALYNRWDSMGLNTAKLTFEQMLASGNFVKSKATALEVIDAINAELTKAGKPIVPPGTGISSLSTEEQKRAEVSHYKHLSGLRAWWNNRRTEAEENRVKNAAKLNRSNVNLQDILKSYTNADAVKVAAVREVRQQLSDANDELTNVKSAAYKSGVLMQTVRELEGRQGRPAELQMRGALNALYQKLTKDDGKFFDVLQSVARLGIDWQGSIVDIRDMIKLHATGLIGQPASPLAILAGTDLQSRALMAITIAYARRNQTVMGLLELRKSDALAERAVVNQLLRTAMSDAKDAMKTAKAEAMRLPKLAALAQRLLTRLENEKANNRALLDEMQRDAAFIDFHEAALPVLREAMERSSAVFGASDATWQANHGASYTVPPAPGATLTVLDDASNQHELKLEAGNGAKVRADVAKMTAWLDAQPTDARGERWNTIKAQRDALQLLDKGFEHRALQSGVTNRLIGSITDRLDRVGHPAADAAAAAIKRIVFLQHSYSKKAELLGTEWSVEEGKVKKALGMGKDSNQDFRDTFTHPMLNYFATRADIFSDPSLSADQQVDKAIAEVRKFLDANPDTSARINRPGAWAALEKFMRKNRANAAHLASVHKEFGLKAQDGSVFRDLLGDPLTRSPRKFSSESERTYQVMRKTGWLDEKYDGPANGWDELNPAEKYGKDPAKLAADWSKKFTPEIWTDFMGALATMPGRSLFNAPRDLDVGGTYQLAMRERVIKAFEATAPGDIVSFAEQLYALEGGTTDMGVFVAETVNTLQNYFALLHKAHQVESYAKGDAGHPTPGGALLDARQTDELPPRWLEYTPLDSHHMRRIVNSMAFEAGAGRNMEGIHGHFNKAEAEMGALSNEYQRILETVNRRGLTGRKRDVEIRALAEASGGPGHLTRLENATRNIATVRDMQQQFDAMVRGLFSSVPLEMRTWITLVRMLAAMTVQGPGTVLNDTISLVEQPLRQYGLNMTGVKVAAGNLGYAATNLLNSHFQLFGSQLRLDAENAALQWELGLTDPDATTTMRAKMAAAAQEDVHSDMGLLGKAATYASRATSVLMNSGLGTAKAGATPVTTLKGPLGVFTQATQHQHAGAISSTWNMHRALIGRAFKFLQANPAALSDPAFKFQPKDLGLAKQAHEAITENLLENGMELETLAKEFTVAKLAGGSPEMFTRQQYQALAIAATSQVMLEANAATRPGYALTNPFAAAAFPLVGWGVSKAANANNALWHTPTGAGGFTDVRRGVQDLLTPGRTVTPEGKAAFKAFARGLSVYAALVPLGLAFAWLREEWDDEVVKKHANVQGFGENNTFLAMIDKLGRVGTFGMWGDLANSALNSDTNRPFTVDNRVFAVSSLLGIKDAVTAWYKQGAPTYQTVGRPFLTALGGSGYLQSVDVINGVLGLDNMESRVVARQNVGNLLKSAGRETGMDVRTGRGAVLPTTTKPWVGLMVQAAYANDAAGFRAAYERAKLEAAKAGHEDPAAWVAKSFSGYHPWKVTFQTAPTQQQMAKALAAMPESGREAVNSANLLFNRYAEMIRGTPFNPKAAKAPLPGRNRLEEFRLRAAGYGSGLP